jgi:hypothetical protein
MLTHIAEPGKRDRQGEAISISGQWAFGPEERGWTGLDTVEWSVSPQLPWKEISALAWSGPSFDKSIF